MILYLNQPAGGDICWLVIWVNVWSLLVFCVKSSSSVNKNIALKTSHIFYSLFCIWILWCLATQNDECTYRYEYMLAEWCRKHFPNKRKHEQKAVAGNKPQPAIVAQSQNQPVKSAFREELTQAHSRLQTTRSQIQQSRLLQSNNNSPLHKRVDLLLFCGDKRAEQILF